MDNLVPPTGDPLLKAPTESAGPLSPPRTPIAALVKQNGLRPRCPAGPLAETVGGSTSTFWPFFAYTRW